MFVAASASLIQLRPITLLQGRFGNQAYGLHEPRQDIAYMTASFTDICSHSIVH
jgi:hypothetical protein